MSLCTASRTALHEVRCRARVAEIIGRPAAKALPLIACQGSAYADPVFLLPADVDRALWLQIERVPGLIRLLDDDQPDT